MEFKRLKELREDNDISQYKVAKILQMKQPQYFRYEKGLITIPIEYLITLSKLYNTSIDYIVGITNEIAPYPKIK